MRVITLVLCAAAAGCANANVGSDGSVTGDDAGTIADASCGDLCDRDEDGVPDGTDQCPETPAGEVVNDVGCSDSQVSPTLEPEFPPYGMTWEPTGELGRAGGLTWTYTGIDRADMFHIYWIVCDDPALACGLSLDGPVDAPGESLQFSALDSDLPAGRLVLTNAPQIVLSDATSRPLIGRLTVTIVDGAGAPIPFATVATLGVPARDGDHGAEIPATDFTVTALAEVQDTITSTWTPYQDYYDTAPTPDPGPGTAVSFGGWFYDE